MSESGDLKDLPTSFYLNGLIDVLAIKECKTSQVRCDSFTLPIHCIQFEKYLIVSDYSEHCIKVFDRKGNFQYKFGKKGGGDGELNGPSSLLVNKSGHLMVCDEVNHRIQVFELNGKFLGKFGIKGDNLGEFNNPISLAVLSNGQIVVCDAFNNRIQILE